MMWKEGDKYKGIFNIMGGFNIPLKIPLINLKNLNQEIWSTSFKRMVGKFKDYSR